MLSVKRLNKHINHMDHFVNPFTDIGFKIIFGQQASKELLITLLNELLSGEHYIEDLTFLDKEDHSDNRNDPGIVYDLYCQTSTGEYIIVEMQNRWHTNFLDRTLYYVCRAISRQVEKPSSKEVAVPEESSSEGMVCEDPVPYGTRYKLPAVYGIFLMNFKEAGLEKKFRTDTVIADRENGKVVNPHFRQIYLQFPYFTKELPECGTLYEKLIYALKNMCYWSRMPDALKEQVFKRLEQLASVANLSEENRIAYDKAVDRYYINRIVEEDMRREWEEQWKEKYKKGMEEYLEQGMKQGLEEGMKQGLEEGMRQGLEEGMKQGLEEGMKQGLLSTAYNLRKMGLSVEHVAQATGLTAEEVESLMDENSAH